ncbi:hypothetical protein BJV78DRAFT_1182090 [Lactifluus subvellereus]|nr:hypothetical protein BJV78DRAFT_1182090 [Lactifluus subvellereus]
MEEGEGESTNKLNNLERLVLAQAVYELGSDAWQSVSSILSHHPLIPKRDNATFSPADCRTIYDNLLQAVGLSSAEPEKQPRNAHSNNLKLAQRMYQARVLELRELILVEEARFKSVAAEIEAIRSGKWDIRIEERPSVDEGILDRPLSQQSERAGAIEGSGSDLTGVSDSSSSVPQVKPLPEEETVQSQLDEDLAIPDSSPRAPAPPSPHEDDVETLVVPQLSPLPSPVGTDDVDEHIDLCASPQLPNESPDPLDIISPADDDGEDEPSPTHERAAAVQPSPSPPRPFEGSERAAAAEPILDDDAEPPETAETQEVPDSLEHPKPSEAAERSDADVDVEVALDESTAASTSQAIEDEMSGVGRSEMDLKDNVSIRSLSEPPGTVRSVELPAPLEDEATSSAPGTPMLDDHELEQAEAPEASEGEETIPLDDHKPEVVQTRQDDAMEVEQGDDVVAASPPAEQSRRDHKRKVSEAASIFSDSTRDRKRTREDSQPVDEDEPGPVRRRGRPPAADSQTSKKFQTVIIMVHAQISQHRNGNIFHNPIKTSEAPDYYDIVKRPMDLKTIKARIREGQITSSAEFQRDVYLMFANSLMYNRPGSDIYTMAEEMMLESETQINSFRQTEGIIKGSHR